MTTIFGRRRAASLFVILALAAGSSGAEVEFFFNTSPSDQTPKLIADIMYSFPLASVGHGTMYISSACRDSSGNDSLIRSCTDKDEEMGVVVSFDVDLQKNTGLYFLAVKRDEFFYGNLDPEKLPETITLEIIDDMDAHFFEKFPFLGTGEYFRRHVEKLQRQTQIAYSQLENLLVELGRLGTNRSNMERLLETRGIEADEFDRGYIWKTAGYLEKNGLSPRGMSRRVVTWGVRFYQGLWSLVYPTTPQEERELIAYINSMAHEDANILSVNCVMPMDKVGEALMGRSPPAAALEGNAPKKSAGSGESPRFVYVPYFVMKRLVKGAFESAVEETNEFDEFIRRPGAYMKFYPQVNVAFDENVPRAPKTYFQNADLIKYYRQYQGRYSNYVTWMIDQLRAQGVRQDSPTLAELRGIQQDLFEEEKRINRLEHEHESSPERDPAMAARIEQMRKDLVDRYEPRVLEIMGATGLTIN